MWKIVLNFQAWLGKMQLFSGHFISMQMKFLPMWPGKWETQGFWFPCLPHRSPPFWVAMPLSIACCSAPLPRQRLALLQGSQWASALCQAWIMQPWPLAESQWGVPTSGSRPSASAPEQVLWRQAIIHPRRPPRQSRWWVWRYRKWKIWIRNMHNKPEDPILF